MNWARVVLFVLVMGISPLALAAEKDCPGPGCPSVTGELLKIEEGSYIVKEDAGKVVRMTVDKSTRVEGKLKVGDRIEAKVKDNGHAVSVQSAK